MDVEYKENTVFPDKENVYVLIDIENKNGANQEFIPEGTLQFIGASGKIYVQEDGKAWNMQSFIEKINKIRKYRKEISNLGIVKIGVPVLIDRSSPNLCVNSLWQIRSPRFKLHLPGYRHYSPPSAVFLC